MRLRGAGSGGTSSGTATQTAAIGTSPFVINITWDSSVSAAPAAFTTAVLNAAQYLELQFTNAATINITVGYGEVDGTPLAADVLGFNQSMLSPYSYRSLVSALSTDATSSVDMEAVASLPSTAPVGGTFWTTTAEAKALGLSTRTTGIDGYVGFSSETPWTYGDTAGVAPGTYDFNGIALHELTEVMGRILLTGTTIAGVPNSYTLMDLFHYQAPRVREFSAGTAGYFSADGGTTSLGAFNTVSSGDTWDWASSVTNDLFDAFSSSGVVNPVSPNDLSVMDVIGWNRAPALSSASTSVPTGTSIAAATSGLNSARTSSGLAAKAGVATIGRLGAALADNYTYALGGTNASSFTLTTSSNTAALAVGNSAIAGAAGGKLYSVTVTPTDKTSGLTGTSGTIGVVVASSAGDTVNVATLAKTLGTSTPTFVYGLAGNDTLNGAGMTGNLFITGGAGADTMTGGSGVNDYRFGSTADSTSKALDTITNFKVTSDVIDFAALGTKLTYAGQIASGAKLSGASIAWQQSGENTLVYLNTGNGAQPLASASMEIKLTGLLVPTISNFAHA